MADVSCVFRHYSGNARWLVDVDGSWKRIGLGVELFIADTHGAGSYVTFQIVLPFCLITISRIASPRD